MAIVRWDISQAPWSRRHPLAHAPNNCLRLAACALSRTPLSLSAGRAQFIANLGLGLIYCQIRNISFLFTIIHLARYAHSCTRKNTTQMYIRVSRARLWMCGYGVPPNCELLISFYAVYASRLDFYFLGCASKLFKVRSRFNAEQQPVMNSTRKIERLFHAKSKAGRFRVLEILFVQI